ncbi:MAG: FecCD family ABC transporter permease [Rhodospirillaceae bacterium]
MTSVASQRSSFRERPFGLVVTALGLLVFVLTVASIITGRGEITGGLGDLVSLWRRDAETAWLILSQVRVPRTLLALLVGASLGLSGAVLQGLLRNPLAEPALLGASSSAALGAVAVFYFGAGGLSYLLPVGGMAGTLIATALLILLGGRTQDTLTLVLAGVAINALTAALTSLALNFAPSPYAALEIVFWILGSFADRTLDHVAMAMPAMVVGWVLLFSVARPLEALSLGEDTAATLGFEMRWVKLRAILGTASCVGAAVAVTGVISFVGLVVPHLIRPLVGYRPGRLLLPSMIGGAALMLAADIGVRMISTALELKVGVITAIIGAPFFLHLLIVLRRSRP